MTAAAGATTLADLPEDVREGLLDDEPTSALQLFPPLSDRDLEELRESVAARGIRVPIEVDAEGRVLDGHHRLLVAQALELAPGEIPVVVREDLDGEEDVLEYVLEVNLGRRHLTPEDRAQVAAALRRRGWSLRRIADRVGVGKSTIARDLSGSGVPDGTGESDDDPPDRVRGRDGKTYPASYGSGSEPASTSDGPSPESSGSRPPAAAQGRESANGRARDGGSPSPADEDPDPTSSAGGGSPPPQGYGSAGARSAGGADREAEDTPDASGADSDPKATSTGTGAARNGDDRFDRLSALREELQELVGRCRRGESDLRRELKAAAVACQRAEDLVDRGSTAGPGRRRVPSTGPSLRERAGEAWEEVLEAVANDAEGFVEDQLPAAGRTALESVGGWDRIRESSKDRLRGLRARFVTAFAAAADADDREEEVVL